jgi:hypothetical protein
MTEWHVKCPRCKIKWVYVNRKLFIGPMYKYCPKCYDVIDNIGGVDGRGIGIGTRHNPRGKTIPP